MTTKKTTPTELAKALDALRKNEALFRAIFEQSRDGIGLAHLDGTIIMVNPALCELFGFQEEEILGQSLLKLVPPGQTLGLVPHIAAGDTLEGVRETTVMTRSGSSIPIEVNLCRIEVGDESLMLGMVRDARERKQAEAQQKLWDARLQQSQRLESLGILAGGIAHDFNNILVGVLGNAGLAMLDLPANSPAKESVQHIEQAAIRATKVVQQMLAYSGKGHFVIERLDLGELVRKISHLLKVSVSKHAMLKYEFDHGAPPIEADLSQMRQVLMNLISNASEALGEQSGVITVRVGTRECSKEDLLVPSLGDVLPPGTYSYVEIEDDGEGMTEEVRTKMFEPFFSTKFTGRGLGLAAVHGIVRGHRGALKVTSELGKGTTITALFPSTHRELTERDTSQDATGEVGTAGVILVVDDEEAVRIVAKRMLTRLGYRVITAIDEREALELFRADPDGIVCVLLDLNMANLDREQCLKELRIIRDDVCVILTSGYSEKEVVSSVSSHGHTGFLQKPYRVKTLAQKIEEVLAASTCDKSL